MEIEGEMEVKGSLSNARPATARAYFCQDFEWEHLRDEVERSGLLKFPDLEKEEEVLPEATEEPWIRFHEQHSKGNFFKERRYLVKEFPELLPSDKQLKVLEVGCGTGSSVLPILRANSHAIIYACDCSHVALERAQELAYVVDSPNLRKDRFFPFHCDVCKQGFPDWFCCGLCRQSLKLDQRCKRSFGNSSSDPETFGDGQDSCMGVPPRQSLNSRLPKSSCCVGGANIAMMVFTLSSIPPENMRHVIKECYSVLEPGGLLLFRDYGLYDMTMLRFSATQRIGKNLYQRHDGTLSYFFTPEFLRELVTTEGFIEMMKTITSLEARMAAMEKKGIEVMAQQEELTKKSPPVQEIQEVIVQTLGVSKSVMKNGLVECIKKQVQEIDKQGVKELNLRIGGLPIAWEEGNPTQVVPTICNLFPNIQWGENSIVKGWKAGPTQAIIQFKNKQLRNEVLKQSRKLQGTKFWFSEDLTLEQLKVKPVELAKVRAARAEGKWAVYRDGKALIRAFSHSRQQGGQAVVAKNEEPLLQPRIEENNKNKSSIPMQTPRPTPSSVRQIHCLEFE